MLISICDDDKIVLAQLTHLVSAYFREKEIEYAVECYSDPGAFLAAARARLPDVAFVDLALGDADGFKVAEELRTISLDTEIVFITSFSNRMPSAFAYKPIAFLEKPVSEESIQAALSSVLLYQWHVGLSYLVRVRGEDKRIPHKSIEYFECGKHQVFVHTAGAGEPLPFPGKLDAVEPELKGLPYIRCHKSFIVQLDAVRSLERSTPCFVTNTGNRVPISRKYFSRAVQAFLHRKLR